VDSRQLWQVATEKKWLFFIVIFLVICMAEAAVGYLINSLYSVSKKA